MQVWPPAGIKAGGGPPARDTKGRPHRAVAAGEARMLFPSSCLTMPLGAANIARTFGRKLPSEKENEQALRLPEEAFAGRGQESRAIRALSKASWQGREPPGPKDVPCCRGGRPVLENPTPCEGWCRTNPPSCGSAELLRPA